MKRELITELKEAVKGAVRPRERLARHTSFRIGGPADLWVEPADAAQLKKLVKYARKNRIPLFIIGGGTNLLVSDEGYRGIVVHLGSGSFKKVTVAGTKVRAGAGVAVSGLVRLCCSKSLGGLESLIGIPGTIGGAVRMNAGGWNSPIYKNIGDLVASVKVMDHSGNIRVIRRNGIKFGYRSSSLRDVIILEAAFDLHKEDKETLKARCSQFLKMKKQKQALDAPSAGCVFKNPPDSQFTCGQMIDTLGLKGKRVGGAEVSERHANFIINRKKEASCKDVLSLVEFIKKKVMESYHIPLELEIEVLR
ncbi:MAG: UDP-N-acetylmuramate dehydrogenase [Candidatus Omnitrophica bacterium]|nr:UDP-N-acetylmuramate dehydrogenase [Candidatus Omnitrophota bacterium]